MGGSAGAQHSTWLSSGASASMVCQVTRNCGEEGVMGRAEKHPNNSRRALPPAQPQPGRSTCAVFHSERLIQRLGSMGGRHRRPAEPRALAAFLQWPGRQLRVRALLPCPHPPTLMASGMSLTAPGSKRTRRVTSLPMASVFLNLQVQGLWVAHTEDRAVEPGTEGQARSPAASEHPGFWRAHCDQQ